MRLPIGSAQNAHIDTELLSSYLDNQVAPQERLRVEQHLRTCSACQTELNSLRQTVSLLQALPRVHVPRPFTLSEAQVGVRRQARARWYWGAARALGAAAALVLVAVLAVQFLERSGQQRASQVARVAQTPPAAQPTAAPQPSAQELAAPQAPTEATQPSAEPEPSQEAASPAPTRAAKAVQPASTVPSVRDQAAPTKKPAAAAPTQAPAAVAKAVSPTTASSAQAATPGSTATSTGAPNTPALAAASQASPQPGLELGPMALSAQGTEAPPPAAPLGRGGGGGGAAGSSQQPGLPLPPQVPLDQALSGTTGLVYTDHQSIKSVDSHGTHDLVQAPGGAAPVIAPDRSWVAYRIQSGENAAIWAVRWDGTDAHVIADSGQFPSHDDVQGGPVQIETMQWLPGDHRLGLIVAVPDTSGTGTPRRELWTANPQSQAPHFVLELGLTGSATFSPDGKTAAVLQRGGAAEPQGRLYLVNVAGGAERLALEFPANANGYGYEGQVSWLPDSKGLWLAVPDPNAVFPEATGLGLYRVSAEGKAELAGHLQASDTFWSPDGNHLAYTRPLSTGSLDRELGLANADGSNPQDYAAAGSGGFGSWSPDSSHFIYYTGDQWYVGGPDQQPQAIGPVSNVAEPHWVGPAQLLYLLDNGANWELVSRTADGKTSSLTSIPKEAEITMTGR